MLQPKSITRGNHSTLPRRSPRLLQPKTPDLKAIQPQPQPRRHRVLRSPSSLPLSSTPMAKDFLGVDVKSCKEKKAEPKTPVQVHSGLRRSARLSVIPTPKQDGLPNANVVNKVFPTAEKRVTRSCSRLKTTNHTTDVKGGDSKTVVISGFVSVYNSTRRRAMPEERKTAAGSNNNVLQDFAVKTERRVTRRATGQSNANKMNECTTTTATLASEVSSEEGSLLFHEKHHKLLCTPSLLESGKEGDMGRRNKQIAVKRKRNQNEEEECLVIKGGWTKGQELALQSAYFSAKPTPHFWKKVARMVPGKSAQECFDKVHSDPLTPPQVQRRSRAKRSTLSPLSFSASKLLHVTESERKKMKYRRSNGRHAHKTLRHLLQKQCHVGQEQENDLFASLEAGTVDLSTEASQECTRYCTPEHKKGVHGLVKRFQESSSSSRRKTQVSHLSTSGSGGSSLISPPVLKQIKNKALLEKYIDQLHSREAKRKVALARAAKRVTSSISGIEEGNDAKVDAIKAAKSALFFDARDAIDQFEQLCTKAMEENSEHSDEDEEGENGT